MDASMLGRPEKTESSSFEMLRYNKTYVIKYSFA